MTTFITVLDAEQVVTLLAVEPANVAATIARNPGVHHSVTIGAPGHAVESMLTPAERQNSLGSPELSSAARQTQELGYSVSRSEVIDGVTSVAVPLRLNNLPPAAVAVVHFNLPDPLNHVVEELRSAAHSIAHAHQ